MAVIEVKRNKNSALEKELVAQHRKVRADFLWIFEHSEMLRAKYPNKYVAVKNQTVAYWSASPKGLLDMVAKAKEDINDFAVEFVRKEPTCFLM
jgi:hypothetical protein